jgi:hypothetical protein
MVLYEHVLKLQYQEEYHIRLVDERTGRSSHLHFLDLSRVVLTLPHFLPVKNVKQNGNIKSNALYNPDERKHPPPTNMSDSERDSELEKYIRS